MENKIEEIIRNAEDEIKKNNPCKYIPALIEAFKEMKLTLKLKGHDFEKQQKRFVGLGRVITDDFYFSESELGTMMLELLDQYLKLKK